MEIIIRDVRLFPSLRGAVGDKAISESRRDVFLYSSKNQEIAASVSLQPNPLAGDSFLNLMAVGRRRGKLGSLERDINLDILEGIVNCILHHIKNSEFDTSAAAQIFLAMTKKVEHAVNYNK